MPLFPPGFSPQLAALAILVLSHGHATAAPDYSVVLDARAMSDVHLYLEHKDCSGAIKALNKGIANNQRAVLLMAGSMYEQGICLKADWNQAAHYYQRAHEAGNPAALPRLISGFAEKKRDPAAALWWSAKIAASLPAECMSANKLVDDPDAFVAALNAWPRGQIDACVYATGVLQRITGEVEFPPGAAQQGLKGDAIMAFVPATGTISWTRGDASRIAVRRLAGDGDNERTVFKDTFLKHLNEVSERTLKQFDKPDGVNPAWVLKRQFVFSYDN